MDERTEFTKLIIDRALKDEHTKFNFIRSLDELYATKKCKAAIKEVKNGFKKTAKHIYNDYLASIDNNTDRLDLLMSYKQIMKCAEFYKKDEEIVSDMISEYRCYLRYGHLFKSILLNYYRPEKELTDWRKLPIGL